MTVDIDTYLKCWMRETYRASGRGYQGSEKDKILIDIHAAYRI